jgi:hypothetical protein
MGAYPTSGINPSIPFEAIKTFKYPPIYESCMEGQKIFVIILSIINLILFGFAAYWAIKSISPGLFLAVFPLLIGFITFIIVREVKKFEMLRALKYANIAFFVSYLIPIGILIAYQLFFAPRAVALYGVIQPKYGARMDPIVEQCIQKCKDLPNETTKVIQACIDKCR